MRFLERVGVIAAHDHPDLAGRFRAPSLKATNAAFLARASDLLALARTQQDQLGGYGLAAAQLDALDTLLTSHAEATERINAARAMHVGAAAGLSAVAGRLIELVEVLDVLNRTRFAEDAARLAAWLSAKNIAHPRRPVAEPVAPEFPRSGRERREFVIARPLQRSKRPPEGSHGAPWQTMLSFHASAQGVASGLRALAMTTGRMDPPLRGEG